MRGAAETGMCGLSLSLSVSPSARHLSHVMSHFRDSPEVAAIMGRPASCTAPRHIRLSACARRGTESCIDLLIQVPIIVHSWGGVHTSASGLFVYSLLFTHGLHSGSLHLCVLVYPTVCEGGETSHQAAQVWQRLLLYTQHL